MSVGEPSGGPGRAKLLGFGLIGVGIVAAGFGTVTLLSEDSSPSAAAPETSQVQPPAPAQSPAPVLAPPPPAPITHPPQTTTSQPPANNQQTPGADQDKIVVRVFNNSTIPGLARRAADDFTRNGYVVPQVDNYARGIIPTTTFYYRPGTPEEKLAKDIATYFGAQAAPRFPDIQNEGDGIIAIVTNDYRGPTNVK